MDTRKSFTILVGILGMLQIVDLISTYAVIDAGGNEGNPIAATMIGTPYLLGAVKLGAVATLYGVGSIGRMRKGLIPAMFAIVAYYLVVVGWNLTNIY